MSSSWSNAALEGRLLVEASAGTGKTWTLAALYLRLIVEQRRSPLDIVVTTFTEAAAQELRGRIRDRLRDAAWWLQHGSCSEAAVAEYMATRLQCRHDEEAALRRRLRLALLELDAAPIGTLHGFCLRVLREYPLETRSDALGLALVDEPALRREVLDDIWRGMAQSDSASDPITRVLLDHGREALLHDLGALLQGEPALRVPDAQRLDEAVHRPHARSLAPAWLAMADDAALFSRSNAALRNELRRLATWALDGEAGTGLSRSELGKLLDTSPGRAELAKQLHRDRQDFLEDRFLLGAIENARMACSVDDILLGAGLARCRDAFVAMRRRRLEERRLIGYDDMIGRVHESVHARDERLTELLFRRWPAALVDEFQDTDPRQYAIFDRVFRDAAGDHRGSLLLVGDPKQAIYGFRGGDVHTYQRAAASSTARLELTRNFRATRPMVRALNTLYEHGGDGFRIPDGPGHFAYVPVEPTSRRDGKPYTRAGRIVASPLSLHELPSSLDPAKAPLRTALALESCAGLIASELGNREHHIGDRALRAGDIAVLLPRHQDVYAMRKALRRHGIPATGAGRSDVFSTDWARALQLQLWSWLHPTDADAVRAALLSPLHGVPLDRLHPQTLDPEFLGAAVRLSGEYAERWRRGGVAAALAPLIESQSERLMRDPAAGERALTDLRHLAELLAVAESGGHRGESLWHWLAARRSDPSVDADARQLRIESDAQRVRLMTLHAAKGLEFPWVLLPLMWNHSARSEAWPTGTDADTGERFVDLHSASYDESLRSAAEEDQRERLRVLYVALTRASHRCDVWVMDPERVADGSAKSARSEQARSALDLLLAPLFARRKSANAIDLDAVNWQTGWPQHAVSLGRAVPTSGAQACRDLPPVPELPSLASFSSLTHQRRAETRRAQDEIEPAGSELPVSVPAPGTNTGTTTGQDPASPHPELIAWDPARGPAFGNALHAMFERRDAARPMSAQHDLIRACLREFGCPPALWRADWLQRVATRLDCVLATPLEPGLRLADLAPDNQRAELDFRIHLDGVSLARLKHTLADLGAEDLLPAGVPLRALTGLLTGKIDLVFEHRGRLHVLDYKSNRLGPGLTDYAGAALNSAMQRNGYGFQALLYTLAVHRYARQRLPGYRPQDHLGPCWYLFLRGIGIDSGFDPALGIWRRQFPAGLIEAVDEVFAGALPA